VKPIVLIAATSRWVPTARLAIALSQAGFLVDAVCPARHPLGKIRALQQRYLYRGLTPLSSFAHAIAATKPDLIVPGDDLATLHLQRLHHRAGSQSQLGQLIESSLGRAESFPTVQARTAFMELAERAGVRVPKTAVIENAAALKKWAVRMGFPTVLKANGTSGGDGVRIVRTLEEAERALRSLAAPPLLSRAVKRAVIDRDKTLLRPWLMRRSSVVNAQEFVAGREATSAVACWQGRVLAGLHFEVVHKRDSAGPSSVVRVIENAEMLAASEEMVARLGLSGLHGFDFMVEAHTGNAYLIEINPRATQVGHLTLGSGRDLPAALYAAVSGTAVEAAPRVTENDTIALFPQEWMRDAGSPFLRSAYHDVPWEEPELMQSCLRLRRKPRVGRSQPEPAQAFSPVRLPRL
jgi:formate-dependent phosphoribosylglycinamide formyltransferase (GAR transformylase)